MNISVTAADVCSTWFIFLRIAVARFMKADSTLTFDLALVSRNDIPCCLATCKYRKWVPSKMFYTVSLSQQV